MMKDIMEVVATSVHSSISQFRTLFITPVRLSLVTRSVSTSGWCLISSASNPLNSRDTLPIEGRGKRKRRRKGGRGRGGGDNHSRRFNAFSRASQAHSSVNSRDTMPVRRTTNQLSCPRVTHIRGDLVALRETAYPTL